MAPDDLQKSSPNIYGPEKCHRIIAGKKSAVESGRGRGKGHACCWFAKKRLLEKKKSEGPATQYYTTHPNQRQHLLLHEELLKNLRSKQQGRFMHSPDISSGWGRSPLAGKTMQSRTWCNLGTSTAVSLLMSPGCMQGFLVTMTSPEDASKRTPRRLFFQVNQTWLNITC